MQDSEQPTKTLPSAPISRETPIPTERKQIAAILAKLALHYWRPNYSPEQARMVMEDYLNHLRGITPAQVQQACDDYIRKPTSKFFPQIGELLELVRGPAWLRDSPRLPVHRAPQISGPKPIFKSVSEVLRDNGLTAAAEKWKAGQ